MHTQPSKAATAKIAPKIINATSSRFIRLFPLRIARIPWTSSHSEFCRSPVGSQRPNLLRLAIFYCDMYSSARSAMLGESISDAWCRQWTVAKERESNMKTEQQIRERLNKAYEMLGYYWSYLPEQFPEDVLSPSLIPSLPTQAEMIVDRAVTEQKYGLQPPKNLVEAAKGFNESLATCVMLEWVLDLGGPLGRKGD